MREDSKIQMLLRRLY